MVRPFSARKAILLRKALLSLKEKRFSFQRLINRRKESDPPSRGTVIAERKPGLLRETEQTAESESPSRDARIASRCRERGRRRKGWPQPEWARVWTARTHLRLQKGENPRLYRRLRAYMRILERLGQGVCP